MLKNINISSFRQKYNKIIQKTDNIDYIRSDLIQLFSQLDQFLRSSEWEYFEDDPDIDIIYDGLLNVHNDIKDFLNRHK